MDNENIININVANAVSIVIIWVVGMAIVGVIRKAIMSRGGGAPFATNHTDTLPMATA